MLLAYSLHIISCIPLNSLKLDFKKLIKLHKVAELGCPTLRHFTSTCIPVDNHHHCIFQLRKCGWVVMVFNLKFSHSSYWSSQNKANMSTSMCCNFHICGAPLANILRSASAWFLTTFLGSCIRYFSSSSAYNVISWMDSFFSIHYKCLLVYPSKITHNWYPI